MEFSRDVVIGYVFYIGMSRFLKYVYKVGLDFVIEIDGFVDSLDWSEKKYCLL